MRDKEAIEADMHVLVEHALQSNYVHAAYVSAINQQQKLQTEYKIIPTKTAIHTRQTTRYEKRAHTDKQYSKSNKSETARQGRAIDAKLEPLSERNKSSTLARGWAWRRPGTPGRGKPHSPPAAT